MSLIVRHWTGREARALRQAVRMSLRDFAAYLGVSQRAISKWEAAGQTLTPRPDTQAVLDTALKHAGSEAQARFQQLLGSAAEAGSRPQDIQPAVAGAPDALDGLAVTRTHPVDGKHMTLIRH
jgi:transcriptional regulator with XRE-family HTH domain